MSDLFQEPDDATPLTPEERRELIPEDARAWIEHTAYAPDEIAVRFHHRLVHIHSFPNGNGRHARLMGDYAVTVLALGA